MYSVSVLRSQNQVITFYYQCSEHLRCFHLKIQRQTYQHTYMKLNNIKSNNKKKQVANDCIKHVKMYTEILKTKNTTIDLLRIKKINKNDKFWDSGCLCRRMKERTGENVEDRGQVYRMGQGFNCSCNVSLLRMSCGDLSIQYLLYLFICLVSFKLIYLIIHFYFYVKGNITSYKTPLSINLQFANIKMYRYFCVSVHGTLRH